MCSFNRLIIHKAVEGNFSDLVTFSIGQGRSRRTVVAFRKTLERAGTDLQLMSEQNLHNKSYGRGRGKNMTPNERVAQWVNQREKRRMDRERWPNKDQANTLSEVKNETASEGFHSTDSTDEKSKSRRTPHAQLYIPPSLRDKNDKEVPLSDDNDQSSTFSIKKKVTDCSEGAANGVTSKPQNRSKGRGRGRKPEMEVYVPRALRETLIQSKELKSSQSSDDGKSILEDINSNCSHKSNVSGASYSVENKSNYDTQDLSTTKSHRSSPLTAPQEITEVITENTEISNDSDNNKVFQNLSSSENLHVTSDCNYTFEFYDPAVLAFMPASPETNEAPNFTTTKLTETTCNSEADQHISVKCENNLIGAHSLEMLISNSQGDMISHSQVDNSCLVAPTVCKALEMPLEGRECKNDSLCVPEAAVDKASDLSLLSSTIPFEANQKLENDSNQNTTSSLIAEEESTEDSWDTMFDDNGDCLDESLMDELTKTVGKVEITKPTINYLKYEPKEQDMDMQALGHVVEIYDFSPELATHDIISAFRDFASRGFDVKWVDDTHALGVFSNSIAANEALHMMHPLLKTRPMSQASKQSQNKARHCQEFLQPYKARPETTSIAAHRLVAGALGMAPRVSREVRDKERQKLKEAKEKRRQEKQQKLDIWDGNFGKCAMDEV